MKYISVALIAVALLLPGVSLSAAPASPDSVDVLIKALVRKNIITEDDAAAVREEMAAIRKEEEAKKKPQSVTTKSPIKLSGSVQARFTHSSDPKSRDTFENKRTRLVLSGETAPRVDFYVQTELAGSRSGVTGATLSGNPAALSTKSALFGRPVVLDALVGYKMGDSEKLSLGQFKVPFGLENLTSDSYLDTINRTQVNESLVPGRDIGAQGRDVGVQMAGTKALGSADRSRLQYEVGLFNGSGINTTDDNSVKDLAGRVVWTPGVPGLSVGLAHYNGASGAAHSQRIRTGGQIVYQADPWVLKSEYISAEDSATNRNGWYVTIVRRLGADTQGVVRYERLNPDTAVANDASSVWTYGLNWFLNPDGYTRFQVNYEQHQEEGAGKPNDQILAQFQTGF